MFTDHLEEIQGPVADAGATDRSAGKERLLSLDVFRGVTVAAMILVTDPGTYSARYSPLCHSEWDGPTPTDIIFPSFLVAIGLAMTLSFTARMQRGANRASLLAHVLRRAVVLIFLGLLVNGFPDYPLHTIRIPGILQHIALCYLAGSILYLTLYSRQADNDRIRRMIVIAAWTIGVLALYWALLKLVPVPGFGKGRLDSLGNFGGYVDRSVFSVRHLWAYGTTPGYGVTFDPDGLLVALSSLGNLPPLTPRSSCPDAAQEDLDAGPAVVGGRVVRLHAGLRPLQDRREDGAGKEVGRDGGIEPAPGLAGPRGPAQARDQGLAHRRENAPERLVMAVGMPVDLAKHRADERQVGDEEMLVVVRECRQVRAKAALCRSRGRRGATARARKSGTDNGLNQMFLCAEVTEESHLVHSGLARDRAGGGAFQPVPREHARGRGQKELSCRGAPATCLRGRVHASSCLHNFPSMR